MIYGNEAMKDKRIAELERLIIHHKQKYYRGETEISDEEYDAFEDELRKLDPHNYVLQVVGYEVTEQKVRHDRPMLSLDKTREPTEAVDWMAGDPCVISDKLDGSSASVIFAGGVFSLAKTRGDGVFGENITPYFAHIRAPKLLLSDAWRGKNVEIRGEVCITRDDFEKLAGEMKRRGLGRPSSIRNIVAGLLHRKDNLDLCRYLEYFAYEVFCDELDIPTEMDKFRLLTEEGFGVPRYRRITTGDELFESIAEYSARTADGGYDYLTDGLVLSVDDVRAQIDRGFTAHHPKGKLAFKFKSGVATTTVRDIEVNLGRTGRLTFVGIVDPVKLSHATVRRVTLNNVKYIRDHRINVGAVIEITRSGEVIPKHERTLEPAGDYPFPERCPVCETQLKPSDTEVDLVCPNELCPAKRKNRVAHWIAMVGIDNIGDETLAKLFEKELVEGIEDLYDLDWRRLSELDKLAEKSARKIVENIQNNKKVPLENFLAGLGIDGLGKGVAALIAERYPKLEHLRGVSEEDLASIPGIGEVLARNVVSSMASFGWELHERLAARGIEVLPAAPQARAGENPLSGETFVITGALSEPRGKIKKRIESAGGKVAGAVSGNTDYLVCNEVSGSSKYKKAQELGVSIIDEEKLAELLASRRAQPAE